MKLDFHPSVPRVQPFGRATWRQWLEPAVPISTWPTHHHYSLDYLRAAGELIMWISLFCLLGNHLPKLVRYFFTKVYWIPIAFNRPTPNPNPKMQGLGSIGCARSVIVIADSILVITTLPGGPDGATPYTPVARPTRLDIFANGFCVQQLSWSNKHALLPSKTRRASKEINAKIVPKRPKNALLSRRPPKSQPRVSVWTFVI